MSQNKEQHYVSKFILRNWSNNGKTINIWIGKNETILKEVSISSQFKKNWIYGYNSKIEKILFANDIEPKMSEFIKEIREKKTIFNDERPQRFILSSLFRTKYFIELNEHNINKIASFVCKDIEKYGYDKERFKLETLEALDLIENSRIKGYEDMFYQCDSLWPVVKTLKKVTLLKTNKEFIIGEIPVVFICPNMGRIIDPLFMIIYPISPKELLVLYRPEDGNINENRTLSDAETHILNSYQFQQTEDIVCFNDESQIEFDIFENQYGVLNKYEKLSKIMIGENSDDYIFIPYTIQGLHFYYDEGLMGIFS